MLCEKCNDPVKMAEIRARKIDELSYRPQKTKFNMNYNLMHPLVETYNETKTIAESAPEVAKLTKYLKAMEESLATFNSYLEQNEAHAHLEHAKNPEYVDANYNRQAADAKGLNDKFIAMNTAYAKLTKKFFKDQQTIQNKVGGSTKTLQSPSKTVPRYVVNGSDESVKLSDAVHPGKLSSNSDVFQYINWKRSLNAYLELNKIHTKTENVQMGVLFGCLDDELTKYLMVHFSSLPHVPIFPNPDDENDYDERIENATYLDAIEQYFDAKFPKALRIFKFLTCSQFASESVQQFCTRLEMLAIVAEWEAIRPNELLKYKIVTGITDNVQLRDKLLLKCDKMSTAEVKKFISDYEMANKMSTAIEQQLSNNDQANRLSHYASQKKLDRQNSYSSRPAQKHIPKGNNQQIWRQPQSSQPSTSGPRKQSFRPNMASQGETAPPKPIDIRCRKCDHPVFYECRRHFDIAAKGRDKYNAFKAKYGHLAAASNRARHIADDDTVQNLVQTQPDGYVDQLYTAINALDVVPTSSGANYRKDRHGLPVMDTPHATPLAYVRVRQINVAPPQNYMRKTPTTEILALADSGATRTLMHINLAAECMFHDFNVDDTVQMKAANGAILRCYGSATCLIEYFGHKVRQRVYIMNDIDPHMIFLSWDVMIAFQIIPREFPLPMEHCQLDNLAKPVPDPRYNSAAIQAEIINGAVADVDTIQQVSAQLKALKTAHPNVEPSTHFDNSADEPRALEELNKVLSDYPVVFDTSFRKKINAPKMRLRFKKGIQIVPFKCTSTIPTPYALRDAARREIQEYLDMGIIRKVKPHEKITWCARSMFIPKQGTNPEDKHKSVRLVVDNKKQNEFLERSPWPFQSPKELAKSIPPSAKYFVCLDLYKGYYQCPIHEDDQLLTSFMVHEMGCFAFTVCPQGNSSSGDFFNRVTDFLVEGIDGCLKLIDDVLIYGDTISQLFKRLRQFTSRCDDNNFTLHPRKIQIGTKVIFAGYVISQKGISIDKKKVNAVREFQRPVSVTDVKAFNGLANQFRDACPNLMGILKPLTEATSTKITPNIDAKGRKIKNSKRIIDWTPTLEQAFLHAKQALTNTDGRVLAPYDPNRQLLIYTDAARLSGYGWVAIQKDDKGHPRLIECGSATVSDSASRNFSVTELELQAVLLALQKMRMMTEGNTNILVLTDHQPLEGLHSKPLHKLETKRQLKMMEKLAEFTYKIKYVSGKKNEIADCLSRYPLPEVAEEELDLHSTSNTVHILAEDNDQHLTIAKLVKAANNCQDYISIKQAIMTFHNPIDLPPDHPARAYKADWYNLAIENELITMNNRILVPKSMRKEVLQSLHIAHLGLQKTTALANQMYFWRGMAKQISQMLDICETCQVHSRFPQKETLKPSIATFPMESNSVDLATHANKKYLIHVDRYTGFMWLYNLKNESSTEAQSHLWKTFNMFGYPKSLRSDNGPQFISDSFIQRCRKDNIHQEFSDPYMSQSNGLAEKYVSIGKNIIKKADDLKNIQQMVMNYNQAPNSSGLSPSQLMFRRSIRTNLPVLDTNLKQVPDAEMEAAIGKKTEKMNKQTEIFNRNARDLPTVPIGTKVRVYNFRTKKWDLTAEVMKIDWNTGRSYRLKTKNDTWIFRNRRFIRVCKNQEEDQVQLVHDHLEGHVSIADTPLIHSALF